MDRRVAETTCEMLNEIISKMGSFLEFSFTAAETEAARQRTRRAIGVCIAELDQEILKEIYLAYSDLRPTFLKQNR